jgi:hypothetical protein
MCRVLVGNLLESEYLEDLNWGARALNIWVELLKSSLLPLQIMCPVFWNSKFDNPILYIKLGIETQLEQRTLTQKLTTSRPCYGKLDLIYHSMYCVERTDNISQMWMSTNTILNGSLLYFFL